MIPDVDVEEALEYMQKSAEPCAKWKAERIYLTEYRKVMKADLMKICSATTAVEREQYAYSHDDYKAHLLDMRESVYRDEMHRFKVKAKEAIVDVWRTQQSNQRSMGKIQ